MILKLKKRSPKDNAVADGLFRGPWGKNKKTKVLTGDCPNAKPEKRKSPRFSVKKGKKKKKKKKKKNKNGVVGLTHQSHCFLSCHSQKDQSWEIVK